MKITWAYLAGLIDGEGSIGTTRTSKWRNLVGRLIIGNTDTNLLYTLQAQFGGSVSVRAKGDRPGWKPFATITWTNRGAVKVLQKTLPHLIVKREQAKLCIELILMRDAPREERLDRVERPGVLLRPGVNATMATLKPKIRLREQAIADAIKALNRKGVPISHELT